MKRGFLTSIVVFTAMLLVPGCIEPQQVQDFAGKTAELSIQVDQLQSYIPPMLNALEGSNVISPEDAEKVRAVSAKIDEIQPHVQAGAAQIAQINMDGLSDFDSWIAIGQATNTATAPVNPYAPIISIALTVLGILGAKFGWSKGKEAKTATLKYQAHKQGTEAFRLENPDKAAALYNKIGEARAALKVSPG